jgi:drug/metabolite transporter (DMT)-like permease
VALLRYVSVFYSFLTDLVVFEESFTRLQIAGAAIVVVTNLLTIFIKVRQEKAKANLAYVGMKDEAIKCSEIEMSTPA